MIINLLNTHSFSTLKTVPNQNKENKFSNLSSLNKIGQFPSYYCPNINFCSRFGDIDFEFDFYAKAKDIIDNHLDKIELTKNLNAEEQEDFRNNLFAIDKPNALQFFFNKKPCMLLTGDFSYFQNNDKYDFVRRTLSSKTSTNKIVEYMNTFVLNKELTKQTIAENKELYVKRMGLKENSSVEDVYNNLVGDNSPLKKQSGYDDIIGVTLGFSPINSILFQLEKGVSNYIELRKRPHLQSEILKRELYSQDSVYNDFSWTFLSNVESAIDSLKTRGISHVDLTHVGYCCVDFVPDEKHTQKVIKDSEDILNRG